MGDVQAGTSELQESHTVSTHAVRETISKVLERSSCIPLRATSGWCSRCTGWRGATRGCRRSGGVDAGCEGTQQQLQHINKKVQRTDTDDSGEEEARTGLRFRRGYLRDMRRSSMRL